eukprot:TRINITY_DN1380_c0_g1_i3.p1 TRINITY_DN1380_c0_g1~~TRINITY_DN1380_c0_g1_i3.p1  ORF type:complete len:332 (-),score=112.05 TRINITY_DN1380_c0_g1_i3:84-1079(-)
MSQKTETHLLVVIHGIFGSPDALVHIRDCLQSQLNPSKSSPSFLVYLPACNAKTKEDKNKTLDGVDAGAKRISEEVNGVVKANPQLKKISVMGFSLGGLYARFFSALNFDKATSKICGLEPVSFLTIASPHLSVRCLAPGFLEYLKKKVSSLDTATIQQMTLDDSDGDKYSDNPSQTRNLCLIHVMSKSGQSLPFLESLQAYKYHTVYANTQHDHFVPYETAAIVGYPAKKLGSFSPSSLTPTKEFPSITAMRKGGHIAADLPTYFHEDGKRVEIEEMIKGLGTIQWNRVDVTLSMSNAHKCVIGKGKMLNKNLGKDVGVHVAQYLKSILN